MYTRTSQTGRYIPDQVVDTDIATASQTSVVMTGVPDPSLRPATTQGDFDRTERSQEAQPKQLSKMEKALLRRATLD